MSTSSPSDRWSIWLLAARPKTLPAAAATAIVGSAVAFSEGVFQLLPALAALVTALLLQIGANLANDVYDYYRGADQGNRLGPLRVTQAGLLTPVQVQTGMWVVFGLAALLGVYLFVEAGWLVLVIGLSSILAAIVYTGGPFPLGYYGFGDLAVFIFFGLASVCGTYFVQAKSISTAAIWAAVPMGLLTVAILVVNNLRDIENDSRVGKRTLAVRWGPQSAHLEYAACVYSAYICLPLMVLVGGVSPWCLLPYLTIPRAAALIREVHQGQGRQLNITLAGTGQLELAYGLLFSFGLVLSTWL